MIDHMREAARLARQAGYERHRSQGAPALGDLIERLVVVMITEQGWVVRGTSTMDGYKAVKSIEVDWPEFDGAPHLLPNAVNLVVRSLEQSERECKR